MKKDFGNIKVIITENYDEMSKVAAEVVAEQINNKPNTVLGLATGSTPIGMYNCLINEHKAGKLDFSKVKTFSLDEYYPIAKDNDQSYIYFMIKNLYSSINIPKENINIEDGEAKDIAAECQNYECKIKAAGGVDLQVLGIGNNGHIGFNEPGSEFIKDTHVVELTHNTRVANSRFFASIDEVPTHAVSMGIKTIMMAKKIIMLVSGDNKADALYDMLFSEVNPEMQSSVLQFHQNVVLVCDKAAAAKIMDK